MSRRIPHSAPGFYRSSERCFEGSASFKQCFIFIKHMSSCRLGHFCPRYQPLAIKREHFSFSKRLTNTDSSQSWHVSAHASSITFQPSNAHITSNYRLYAVSALFPFFLSFWPASSRVLCILYNTAAMATSKYYHCVLFIHAQVISSRA